MCSGQIIKLYNYFDETLCGVGPGHRCEGDMLSAGKRMFGQSGVCNKTMIGMEHGHQYEGGKSSIFSVGKRKSGQSEVVVEKLARRHKSNCRIH